MKKLGFCMLVLTTCLTCPMVSAQGVSDKLQMLRSKIREMGISMEEVAFIGNDLPDIECIKASGVGIAVNNAYPDVLKAADYITTRKGGHGAIREIADFILEDMK